MAWRRWACMICIILVNTLWLTLLEWLLLVLVLKDTIGLCTLEIIDMLTRTLKFLWCFRPTAAYRLPSYQSIHLSSMTGYNGTSSFYYVIHLLLKIITLSAPVTILATMWAHRYRSFLILQFEHFIVAATLCLIHIWVKCIMR